MSDKDEGNNSKKGRGTLRDDAAGSSERPVGTRSWNSVIRRATGNTSSASEDSSSNISEAVEAVAEEHARQKEVSQLAQLEPLNEFLRPREGDDEETIADLDGNIRTVFQDRVLNRITTITELRRSMLMEEGEEGPNVTKLNDELVVLGGYIPRGEGSVLDENSVLFDIEHVIKQRRKSEPPKPSAEKIGPELEEEGVEIDTDTWNDLSGSPEALAKKGVAPAGLGKGITEGAGLSETRLWNVAEPEGGNKDGSEEDESENWFTSDDGVQGSLSEIPARPSMIEGTEPAEIPVLEGVEIRPVGPEEMGLVGALDELDYATLQEMALERKLLAETNIERAKEIGEEVDIETIENLLAQSNALEKESDRRNPNNVEEAVPAGTVVRSREDVDATGPVGAGVSKKEEGTGRMETVVGIRPERPKASRPPSSRTDIRKKKGVQETSKPVGAGVSKAESRPREKSILGINAAMEKVASGERNLENIRTGDSRLSQSRLFAEFNDDTEVRQGKKEGSKADILVEIIDEERHEEMRGVPKKMDTGAMRRGEDNVGDAGRLEGTSIRLPQKKKRERREPTQKEIELAKTMHSALTPEGIEIPATKNEPRTTAITQPLEDFSKYGDIFYAMETVFVESGKRRDVVGLKDFDEELAGAIGIAEAIAAEGYTVYDGNLSGASPEMRRVQRLRAFKKEFVDVPEGETEPKKDIKQYLLWHEMQSAAHNNISEVFDILEISPGEYSRKGILRICDVYLESKGLDAEGAGKVQALKGMLEAKENGGEVDEFAAERLAELNYEMVVGFGTKRERELRKNQVEGILRMEAELKELKFKISTFKQKETQMVEILANLYASVRRADSKQEGMAKYVPEIRRALMELEPDYKERDKYMKALFRGLKGEGEIGAWLGKKAKEKLDWELRTTERESADQARYSRKSGGVAKGIGIATLPLVGAAILAGGLWLGQQGITLPFVKNAVDAQKDAAAEVETAAVESDTEARLPAGVVGGVDAQAEEEEPEGTVETDSALGGTVPEPEEEAEEDSVDNETEAVEIVQPEEAEEVEDTPGEEQLPYYNQPRTRMGLRLALTGWCEVAEYGAVDNIMLRAAYASIEEKLIKRATEGGKEIPLPGDASWPKHMVRMKFSNPLYEIAVLSDMWRLKGKSIEPEVKYAVGMRLAAALGYRAGDDMKFAELIGRMNSRIKRKNKENKTAVPLIPELGKDTLLGTTEYAPKKRGNYIKYTPWQSCCLVSKTLYDLTIEDLQKDLDGEKIFSAEDAILEKLSSVKEVSEERYQELAGEIEEIGHYFVTEAFTQRVIEIVERVAGKGAEAIIEKIETEGIYRDLGKNLAGIEGVDKNEVKEAVDEILEIKADKKAKERSKAYMKRVLEAIDARVGVDFSNKKSATKFLERMEKVMERSVKERAREFIGKVKIALGAMDDKVFEKFKKAKYGANHPRRTKKLADACRVFTQNKKGRQGLGEAPGVNAGWKHKRKVKKREKADADKLTGDAIKDKRLLEKERKRGEKIKKKKKRRRKKDGSGRVKNGKKEDTLDYLKKQFEKQSARNSKRNKVFSYRGGVDRDENGETLRREKKEAYLERFRFRGGVTEKKSFPIKRLASKLGMKKGLERATARA